MPPTVTGMASVEARVEDAQMRNQKSPISTMPLELLHRIFKMAQSPSPFTKRGRAEDKRVEIFISHVSHTWRSSSLACSDLWSTFFHDAWGTKSCVSMDCLSTYLERSGNRPLDVWIGLSDSDVEGLETLFYKLVEHAKRWRRLSFTKASQFPWPVEAFHNALENVEAPNLESLEIYIPSPSHGFHPSASFLKGGTPKLSHLRADAHSFDGLDIPLPNLSTLQIETFNSRYFPWSIFLDILALPSLQNLSITRELFDEPDDSSKSRVVVARLLKHFRCADPVVFSHMWSVVQAPNLEVLIFSETPLEGCIFPFDETQARDNAAPGLFPSLHTLALLTCNTEDLSTPLLLAHATKAVRHLYVSQDDTWADRSVFHIMAEVGPEFILWPNLKTLTCIIEMTGRSFEYEPASCLEVVECRSRELQKHCTLRLFDDQVYWWRTKDPDSWKLLQDGGFYEKISGYCYEGDIDYVPWPPRAMRLFHFLSEEKFLSQSDDYEED